MVLVIVSMKVVVVMMMFGACGDDGGCGYDGVGGCRDDGGCGYDGVGGCDDDGGSVYDGVIGCVFFFLYFIRLQRFSLMLY